MPKSRPAEHHPPPLTGFVTMDTVTHPRHGEIHAGGIPTRGSGWWAVWGNYLPTMYLGPERKGNNGPVPPTPEPYHDPAALVFHNGWSHLVDGSIIPIPHRRWDARTVEMEGRTYVRKAVGKGSVITRDGRRVLTADRRRNPRGAKDSPWWWPLGALADDIDPLDAAVAMLLDRALSPDSLVL